MGGVEIAGVQCRWPQTHHKSSAGSGRLLFILTIRVKFMEDHVDGGMEYYGEVIVMKAFGAFIL